MSDPHLTEENKAGVTCLEFRSHQRYSAVAVRDVYGLFRDTSSSSGHCYEYEHKSTEFSHCCWCFARDLGSMVDKDIFIAVSSSSFQWAKEHSAKAVIPLGSTCSHCWHPQLEAMDWMGTGNESSSESLQIRGEICWNSSAILLYTSF